MGPRFRCKASEQGVPSIGRSDTAWQLFTIEGDRIGVQAVAPERFIETPAQQTSLALERRGARGHAQLPRDRRGSALRAVDIGLHLAERDRRLGEPAVGVEYGIVAVFPTLIDESGRRFPVILDKTVAVAIAIPVDPPKGALNVRP